MSAEIIQQIVRNVAAVMFTFFLYQSVISIVHYSFHKIKASLWNVAMCLTTCVYVMTLYLQSFESVSLASGTALIKLSWISATTSFIMYLYAIEHFISAHSTMVRVSRMCLTTVVLGLIVLYPTDILFDPIFAGEYKTTLAEALSSNYSITNLGRLLGFAILVLVAVSCLGVLFKLTSSKKKEGWLTLGVFVTLVCSAHDAILGATAFLSTIPIYYLGNVFEAIRFTSHYQKKSYSDLKTLEKENIVNKALADEGSVSKKLLRLLSHDINNGVTVSRFGVRKSRRFLEDRDKLEDGLKKIERGLNIIDDISEIVRLVEASRSGMLELDLREVDLRKSIDEVLENFEDRLKEKNLVVRVEVNEAIPSVVAEPISLSNEVIANLLSNAIKFSPENSVVQISAYSEGEFVLLEVKDHGVGIPRELVNVLFDDNSQTTRAGTNGELGNGFGMPLMKNFVENYGGCVEVESETSGDGKGTKFKVFLKSA